jgi:hypothetical protein
LPKESTCAACGKGLRDGELKVWPDGRRYCKEHEPEIESYGLDLVDYLKSRISVTLSEDEPRIRFVVRELVQNADDEDAAIIVLRFEPDAFYVANDGHPFSTEPEDGEPPDFERIRRVLRRYKAEDKEATGHFGSGFQTVYTLTNLPEIHSNGKRMTLNPIEGQAIMTDDSLSSPYVANKAQTGVLFRFPWRTDAEAERAFGSERPFSDSNHWPRWNAKERKKAFEELKDYLGGLILCCKKLRAIRIVWASDSGSEAYEARRDFDLGACIDRPRAVEVVEGPLSAKPGWFAWDKGAAPPKRCPVSFDSEAEFGKSRVRKYLAASAFVADEGGKELHLVKGRDGKVTVEHQVTYGAVEIKKNHAHLLFSLTPPDDVREKALLYSVIPLPRLSENGFVISAHLIPTEDRKDVDVHGNGGANNLWYRSCMQTFARLFRSTFGPFLERVRDMRTGPTDSLKAVMFNLPRVGIGEWMRPGKNDTEWASAKSEELFDWIFSQPILATDGSEWASPVAAYWAESDDAKEVMKTLDLDDYPPDFVSFLGRIEWLRRRAEPRRFSPRQFAAKWEEIAPERATNLHYDGSVKLPWSKATLQLRKETVKQLMTYALTNPDTSAVSIVPGKDGLMRPLSSYPKVPTRFKSLEELLPDSRRVHPDLDSTLSQLESKHPKRTEVEVSDMPGLISSAVAEQPSRFERLSPSDHRALSETVRRVVLDPSFARKKAIGKVFLPYRLGNDAAVGPLPDVDESHHGESYQRDWIFAKQRTEVEGLPLEIASRIRFLDLEGVPDDLARDVEKKLWLVPLAHPGELTDYVRHFLSSYHGTLFDDDELSRFVGSRKRELLERLKREMLKAVREYFNKPKTEDRTRLDPDHMGEVPCLYDDAGRWQKAKEFAVGGSVFASILGYKALDAELARWPKIQLEALGVAVTIGPKEVAEKVKQLSAQTKGNRTLLANLLGAIVTQYPSESLEQLSEAVSTLPWVPVGTLGFARPADALFPTEHVTSILGPRLGSYVDLDYMDADFRKAVSSGAADVIDRLKRLGVRTEPRFSELLDVLLATSSSSQEPPAKLIETMAESMRRDPRNKEQLIGKASDLRFYWNKKWNSGDRVRILETKPAEELPLDSLGLVVLSPAEAEPFLSYLEFIGARRSITVEDYLQSLSSLSSQSKRSKALSAEARSTHDQIWEQLDLHSSEIREETRREFTNGAVLLVGGRWHAPSDTILVDETTSKDALSLGDTCVFPKSLSGARALSRLGAPAIEGLDSEAAYRLMSRIPTAEALTPPYASAYLSLLAEGVRREWWKKEKPLPFPVSADGQVRLLPPAFVGNGSLAVTLRGVPLAVTTLRGSYEVGLENLAKTWGARDLAGRIEYPDMEDSERDRELEEVLALAGAKLVRLFPSNADDLDWIRSIEIRRVSKTIRSYVLGDVRGRFPAPAIVPLGYAHNIFIVPKNQDGFSEQDAAIFSDWAVAGGFPNEAADVLQRALLEKVLEAAESEEDEDVIPVTAEERQELQTLKEWYLGCQLCSWRTPWNEYGVETQESFKSIVSEKGGLYLGKKGRIETGNVLYLCPRHARLASRHLLRFTFMRGWKTDTDAVLEDIRNRIATIEERIPEGETFYKMEAEVFAWQVGTPSKWNLENINLHPTHAKKIYERLARFLSER